MRAAVALLLLSACTLDPRAAVDQASIKVRVEGLTAGGTQLNLIARDSNGRELIKRPNVTDRSEVEVLFERDILAEGEVDIGAVLVDGDGKELACGTARGQTHSAEPVLMVMAAANDDLNCGACGQLCVGAAHASRHCEPARAACGPLVCEADWFDANGDPSDGCERKGDVVTCPAPTPENTLTACADGLDNDCDGDTDCSDSACSGFTRPCSFGACTGEEVWTCSTNSWGACGATASLESSPATCSDGADNDCDGKTDCLDEACNAISQSCSVQTCAGVQSYTCAQAMFGSCAIDTSLEDTPALCRDGLDNDCDNQTDCQEAVCQDPSLEATMATCKDGIDNDCDGKTDCADPTCTNLSVPCSGTDVCAAGVRLWLCSLNLLGLCTTYLPLPENNGLLCGDGLDNDCDQKKDCGDPDCLGRGCALGKVCCPNGTCAKSCG